jgi:hypothetical protein
MWQLEFRFAKRRITAPGNGAPDGATLKRDVGRRGRPPNNGKAEYDSATNVSNLSGLRVAVYSRLRMEVNRS